MFDDLYIDFSKSCRLDKDETMEAVSHDVEIILQCHEESIKIDAICLLPYYLLELPRKKRNENQLYQDIVATMQEKQKSHLLVDIMPWVDSYIEYMCS